MCCVQALCLACGSDPEKGTANRLGSYLMITCFQTTCVSSAMFITAMAANPLAVNLAASAGISISWGTWALAGLVPGLICLVSTQRRVSAGSLTCASSFTHSNKYY